MNAIIMSFLYFTFDLIFFHRDRAFTNSIQRFIARKADLLFSNEEENPNKSLHMYQTYDPGDGKMFILSLKYY